MDSLIERIEAATEGTLDLDREILAALGYTWRGMGYWKDSGVTSEMWKDTSLLTRSLDGAARLVPEGWCWHLGWLEANGEAIARLFRADSKREPISSAATPALALCAAALKARTNPHDR